MIMNYTVVAYLLYLPISVAMTIWVARTLHRNGRVFLVAAFRGNESMAFHGKYYLRPRRCRSSRPRAPDGPDLTLVTTERPFVTNNSRLLTPNFHTDLPGSWQLSSSPSLPA